MNLIRVRDYYAILAVQNCVWTMTTISPSSSLGSSGYSALSVSAAAPAVQASTTRVTNTVQGVYVETLGRLKISEVDGKDQASIFSSSPDEGQVLSKRPLDTSSSQPQTPVQRQPDQPQQKFNDDTAAQAVGQTRQTLIQSNPTPDIVPQAAVQAYQAFGNFNSGGNAVSLAG